MRRRSEHNPSDLVSWRSTATCQFPWVGTPGHPSHAKTPVRPGSRLIVSKSPDGHFNGILHVPLRKQRIQPGHKHRRTFSQAQSLQPSVQPSLTPTRTCTFNSFHVIVLIGYVTSPEFCNLIGAFTFLRTAILLAQEIDLETRPSPSSKYYNTYAHALYVNYAGVFFGGRRARASMRVCIVIL